MKDATAATPARPRDSVTKATTNPPANVSRLDQVSDLQDRSSSLPGSTSADSQKSVETGAPGPVGEERIRQRAYELYLESGSEDGHADEHWLAAEREFGQN